MSLVSDPFKLMKSTPLPALSPTCGGKSFTSKLPYKKKTNDWTPFVARMHWKVALCWNVHHVYVKKKETKWYGIIITSIIIYLTLWIAEISHIIPRCNKHLCSWKWCLFRKSTCYFLSDSLNDIIVYSYSIPNSTILSSQQISPKWSNQWNWNIKRKIFWVILSKWIIEG